ncbi:hypothetical protein UFOVP1228_27 [uncultured Caudovirales phage]|uniref:Uncharacterized protein n=1 Tax=uncultured Caudovirales phage TaxID=2100421 RepID=A0A6J5SK89_9CAUD|nr:hypothetical protein UFOVP956_27 [uncultured Caudovirales phage]CAB4191384.1 hypothetical protein UFOVP1228_27 [uncultured Caudovirales phage]CAB4215312.1 hypothetical protein UFOVP1481_11 [uncultured Caudovirales phage]
MNLLDLRSKVKSITDYSPDLKPYNDQLDDLINDAMFNLWNEKRWKFSQVREFMKVYPDLNAGNTGKNASVQNGSRRITFSGGIPMLLSESTMGPYSSQSFSTAYGDSGSAYEGQIFQAAGREYNILKIVSNTEIHLDEQYRGTTNTDNIDWTIKKRFYDLPDDCQELLNLSQRDIPTATGSRPPVGKIFGLSKRREEELNLREDYSSSYAECYIDTPPVNVPPAEKFKVTLTQAGGGTLPSSTSFELCWAFHYWGAKLGPLSEPLVVTSGADEQPGVPTTYSITLQFTSHDDKPIAADAFNLVFDRVPNKYEGLRKVVFFNQNFNPATGKRIGLPCWRALSTGDATAGREGASVNAGKPVLISDEITIITLTNNNQFNPGNPRYVEWDGSIPRLRPYPRINAFDYHNALVQGDAETPGADEEYFKRLEMRYTKKPVRMVTTTDTPQMPAEFHQLIVYGALEDVYNKSGNTELSATYRKRIDKAMLQLEKRYVDSVDTVFVRQSFSVGSGRYPVYDGASLKLKP